jgi:protein ImuB
MKRVMCIYWPQWPLQRLRHEQPALRGKSVVLFDPQGPRGPQVVACSPLAIREGIRPGMPLAEAMSVDPDVITQEAAPERDRQALLALARWAERYSPIVGLEEGPSPQCLLLDITGCAACFHGEDRLLQRAVKELQIANCKYQNANLNDIRSLQFAIPSIARVAIADTIGAAWALTHFLSAPEPRTERSGVSGPATRRFTAYSAALRARLSEARLSEIPHGKFGDALGFLVPPGETEHALRPLPVAALRLETGTLKLLASLGVERIDQLLTLPRDSLASRFGPLVLQRLDQALGRTPEVIVPHRFLPPVQAACPLAYPADRLDILNRVLERLLERIQQLLASRDRGARELECWLYHETAAPRKVDIVLARPSRSPRRLGELLRIRLEQVQLAEPVTAICLRVTAEEPLSENQGGLPFEEDPIANCKLQTANWQLDIGNWQLAMGTLIERLSSRFGRDAVTQAALVPDPQPEHACRFEPVLSGNSKSKTPSLRHTKSKTRNKPGSRSQTLFGNAVSRNSVSPPLPEELAGPSRNRVSRNAGSQTEFGNQVDGNQVERRPLRLLRRPVPIQVLAVVPEGPPVRLSWPAHDHVVLRAWGPERIETGWWRGQDVHRDYYLVATREGNRFWIFRRRDDGRWFLQGCFD